MTKINRCIFNWFRFVLEGIIILYLITVGPIAPLMPYAIGFKAVSDNNNTVYYQGENYLLAREILEQTRIAQNKIREFWHDQNQYPHGVKVFLASEDKYNHFSLFCNQSIAFVQGNSIIVNLSRGKFLMPVILRHEISHHYLSKAFSLGVFTRYFLPRWLDEGLAVYISEIDNQETFNLNPELLSQLNNISIKDLNTSWGWYKTYNTDQEYVYLFSTLFVGFIIDNFGMERMKQLLSELKIYNNAEDKFKEIYGIKIDQLVESWKREAKLKNQQG